jgi:hypothetical protein
MGELEFGHIYLYSMFWDSSWDGDTYQQSKIRGLGRLDRRAITECTEVG